MHRLQEGELFLLPLLTARIVESDLPVVVNLDSKLGQFATLFSATLVCV